MVLACVAALAAGACAGPSTTATLTPPSPTPSSISAHAELPASIQQSGVLRVASGLDSPPYAFVDAGGAQAGVEVELAQALANDLGLTLTITKVSGADAIAGLTGGTYDIAMSGYTDTAALEGSADFVDYLKLGEGILVPAANPKNITIDTYCGTTFVDPAGSLDLTTAQGLATKCTQTGKAAIKIMSVPTTADAIQALETGTAEASVASLPATAYWSAQSNGKLEAVQGTLPGTDGSYAGIALKKGASQLQQALVTALDDVIGNTEYSTIINKYGVLTLNVTQANVDLATHPSP
jgi:polar amino acid transport system substrate-binding protein